MDMSVAVVLYIIALVLGFISLFIPRYFGPLLAAAVVLMAAGWLLDAA